MFFFNALHPPLHSHTHSAQTQYDHHHRHPAYKRMSSKGNLQLRCLIIANNECAANESSIYLLSAPYYRCLHVRDILGKFCSSFKQTHDIGCLPHKTCSSTTPRKKNSSFVQNVHGVLSSCRLSTVVTYHTYCCCSFDTGDPSLWDAGWRTCCGYSSNVGLHW